jgi:hypothetical protein
LRILLASSPRDFSFSYTATRGATGQVVDGACTESARNAEHKCQLMGIALKSKTVKTTPNCKWHKLDLGHLRKRGRMTFDLRLQRHMWWW